MKRLNYIFVLFAVLLWGCNGSASLQGDDEQQIVVPTKPYIYLDAGISTKASLVGGTVLDRNFAVYGYTYDFSNKWSTYRVTAKPNVFDNVPQNVTHSNGSYKYTPVKEWEGGKYTFFAFYPQTIQHSGANVEGTPYVIYEPDFNAVGTHIDIMTAMFEDTSLSSSPYVYFDFYHRLSAVDVVALNFYEYNHTEGSTTTTEQIIIELNKLQLKFENVQYKAAKIYLDRRIESDRTPADAGTAPDYTIFDYGKNFGMSVFYNTNSDLQSVTELYNNSMIFIPQENTDLKVTTTVKFKKRRPNGTYLTDDEGNEVFTQTIETPFKQALKEGSRYYLQMTFTSSAVSISILTSEEWDDIKVDYEFD